MKGRIWIWRASDTELHTELIKDHILFSTRPFSQQVFMGANSVSHTLILYPSNMFSSFPHHPSILPSIYLSHNPSIHPFLSPPLSLNPSLPHFYLCFQPSLSPTVPPFIISPFVPPLLHTSLSVVGIQCIQINCCQWALSPVVFMLRSNYNS